MTSDRHLFPAPPCLYALVLQKKTKQNKNHPSILAAVQEVGKHQDWHSIFHHPQDKTSEGMINLSKIRDTVFLTQTCTFTISRSLLLSLQNLSLSGLGCNHIHPFLPQSYPILNSFHSTFAKRPACPSLQTSRTGVPVSPKVAQAASGELWAQKIPPPRQAPIPSLLLSAEQATLLPQRRLTSPAPEEEDRFGSLHPSCGEGQDSTSSKSSCKGEACGGPSLRAGS